MPIYEFHCPSCGKNFDKLCSVKDNLTDIECVHCSHRNVIKKMSSFATSGQRTSLDFNENGGGSTSSSCSSCSSGSCSSCNH